MKHLLSMIGIVLGAVTGTALYVLCGYWHIFTSWVAIVSMTISFFLYMVCAGKKPKNMTIFIIVLCNSLAMIIGEVITLSLKTTEHITFSISNLIQLLLEFKGYNTLSFWVYPFIAFMLIGFLTMVMLKSLESHPDTAVEYARLKKE